MAHDIFKCDEVMPASGAEIAVGPRLAAQDRDLGYADVAHPPRDQRMATRSVPRPRYGHDVK